MIIKTTCNKRRAWSYQQYKFGLEIELTGSGTTEDPYILNVRGANDHKYCVIIITHSDLPLKIEGIYLRGLYLDDCTHVTVSDLTVKNLGFEDCSKISVQNAQVTRLMWVNKCKEIKIVDSEIHRFTPYTDDNISFINCDIKKLSKKLDTFIAV